MRTVSLAFKCCIDELSLNCASGTCTPNGYLLGLLEVRKGVGQPGTPNVVEVETLVTPREENAFSIAYSSDDILVLGDFSTV